MSLLSKRSREARAYSGGAFFPNYLIPSNGMAPLVSGGVGMSSDTAMHHPAVYACARLIADIISSLPVDAYTGTPGTNPGEAECCVPKPQVLVKPSDYLSGVQWIHQVMMSVLLQGNAYGLISAVDRLGYPTQIDLVDPQQVMVRKSTGERNTATGRTIAAGTKVFKMHGSTLTSTEMWHFPGPMLPGELSGLSPVKYAARTIAMGNAAEKFGQDFFENGIHPTAVAETDQPVDETQAGLIKTRIRQAVGNRDVAVLGAGVTLKPWQVNPQDSMLIETMRVNQLMICQVFGVPPEMIGASTTGSSLTYANREQRAQDFLNNGINPWLVRLEDSLSALFPRTTCVKFDTKGFLKSDLTNRYNAWKTGIEAGFLLPEEARRFEDLPEVELPETPDDPSAEPGEPSGTSGPMGPMDNESMPND